MGFGIKKEGGSSSTPSEIVNFDQVTPTTPGVIFDPDTPETLDILYVSSVNASTWVWNGTAYVTYSAPSAPSTEWYLLGTTIDAGSNKTARISRNNSIYTINSDSYFNLVRIGRGGGSISTNTVVGMGSGTLNTIGSYNSFLGGNSGGKNTTGSYNTFNGYNSGYNNTVGISNTFIGRNSGYNNIDANNNTFVGDSSGFFNTTGSQNTFLGVHCGAFNTTGNNNTFNGYQSGYSNTTGANNSFYGTFSGYINTTGNNNTFFGKSSGANNSTGASNTFIGNNSGENNTTGSSNLISGFYAGRFIANGTTPLTIANQSVFLGANTKSLADNQTNEIVIGYNTIGKGSNTVNIGNSSITGTYLNGAITVNNAFTLPTTDGTANQTLVTDGSGVISWSTAAASSYIRRHETTESYDYLGYAIYGTSESDPTWTLTRLTLDSSGVSVVMHATYSWTNRVTAPYV